MMVTVMPVVIGALGKISRSLVRGSGRVGNRKTSIEHPNYCTDKIGQITEKIPGDLKRLGVTKTYVRDHQLWLVK